MKKLIFNPFTKIAGTKALIIGLSIIILSALLCYPTNTHFDGVLDIHFSGANNIYIHLIEGITNLISIVFIFSLTVLIIVGAKFRFIDLLGTMSLSRAPLIIIPIFSLILPLQKMNDYFTYTYSKIGTPVEIGYWDIISFIVFSLIIIFVIIWTITLMYNAFRICMNVKGAKAVASFVTGLLLAEVLSKVVFYYFINPIS